MHEGHRERMRERVFTDIGGMCDHELLEVLLFGVLPRVNTNPLAHTLIDLFGSLEGVFNASREELLGVEGVGETAACLIMTAGELYRRTHPSEKLPLAAINFEKFSEFAGGRFRASSLEKLELYAFDAKSRVQSVKTFSDFVSGEVDLTADEILGFLVSAKPFAVAAAHNHPSDPAVPSASDDDFTSKLCLLCLLCGVRLTDHVIFGADGTLYSYFTTGRLDEIRAGFGNDILSGKNERVAELIAKNNRRTPK